MTQATLRCIQASLYPQYTGTVLNILFHWSPLICTSIVFRDRSIVMWQSLLFSQLIKNNLSNRCGIALYPTGLPLKQSRNSSLFEPRLVTSSTAIGKMFSCEAPNTANARDGSLESKNSVKRKEVWLHYLLINKFLFNWWIDASNTPKNEEQTELDTKWWQ